jgi:methylated-DNA-protein-cysteine methyltransferase-like protein
VSFGCYIPGGTFLSENHITSLPAGLNFFSETGADIMTPFTKQVVAIIAAIPEGKVMTYGQIAACAGSPRAARQVVRILHSMSRKERLPWHRVVNAKGQIAIIDEESRMMQETELVSEGVEFQLGGSIDLQRFGHVPDPELLLHDLTSIKDEND